VNIKKEREKPVSNVWGFFARCSRRGKGEKHCVMLPGGRSLLDIA